uniref:SJCHGC09831 protein n=1 Tax=Schistosoma japonicum TaxID=6182 RepID=Q5BQS0_SCHJA|nr:SJCHGC09831 protein [Schistosoma japonicum]
MCSTQSNCIICIDNSRNPNAEKRLKSTWAPIIPFYMYMSKIFSKNEKGRSNKKRIGERTREYVLNVLGHSIYCRFLVNNTI